MLRSIIRVPSYQMPQLPKFSNIQAHSPMCAIDQVMQGIEAVYLHPLLDIDGHATARQFRKRATRKSRFAYSIGAEVLRMRVSDDVVCVENVGMIVSYDFPVTVARRTNTHAAATVALSKGDFNP